MYGQRRRTRPHETSMLAVMSSHSTVKRVMAPDIAAMKGRGEPIVALTAYHAHTAAIADRYCDFLLVGDSLGMVMHGYETTVPVPLELMIMHGRAVVRPNFNSLDVGVFFKDRLQEHVLIRNETRGRDLAGLGHG